LKIFLDNLDFQIPADQLEQIRMACESGQVRKVTQVTTHEWLYVLRWEVSMLECKLSYTSQSVSAISCACGCHSSKNPCIHAWALAYWHQNYRDQQVKTGNQLLRNQRKSFLADLHLKSHSELGDFLSLTLKFYPDLYKWSALLLPSQMEDSSIFDYYLNAMSEFNQVQSSKSQLLTIKDIKTKLLVLEQVQEKALQYYLQGEMEKPFSIFLAMMVSAYRWVESIPGSNASKFKQKIIYHIQTLMQIIKTTKAPDLRSRMYDTLVHTMKNYPHFIIQRHDNLLSCLYLFVEQKKKIKEFEKNELTDYLNSSFAWYEPLETLWFLYHQYDSSHWVHWIQKDSLLEQINPIYLIQFSRELTDRYHEEKSQSIASLIFMHSQHPECRQTAMESLLEIYVRNHQNELLVEASGKAAMELKQLKFVKIWKDASSSDMEGCTKFALEYKKSKIFDKIFYYKILGELELLDLLLAELESEKDILTLMQFDHLVADSDPDRLLGIYMILTEDFLTQHVGSKAYEFVEKVKKHFLEIRQKNLEKDYSTQLQNLFPDRISLYSHIDKIHKIEI